MRIHQKGDSLAAREQRTAWLTLLPIILILLTLKAYPMISAILKSLTNWDGLYRQDFVGFSNYLRIFRSNEFGQLIANNLFLLLHIPIQLFLAFIFALLLYEQLPGWKLFRVVYFLPNIISVVIIGTLFRTYFSSNGIINTILRWLGLHFLTLNWLSEGFTALLVIMFAMIWQSLGWQMLILSGGMASMNHSVIEAAKIDGAGYWKRLFHVVVPMQVRAIEFSFVVSIIWVFSGLFSFINTITNGGPGYSTATLDYMIYLKAFGPGAQLGVASAYAVLLLVIVLALIWIQRMVAEKAGEWSE